MSQVLSARHATNSAHPTEPKFAIPLTSIYKAEADGVQVFYRAAGDPSAPVVLLLHGFPTSSFMFRELIPRLADRYRVIAPDLPGFGFTEVPTERKYVYSFDALAVTLEAFTDALGLDRYAIYVFDYGAPTGLRLPSALQQSFHRTAMPTKTASATHGRRSGNIGPLPQQKTGRYSGKTFSRRKEPAGSTRTA
jgi:alpha/beta hydrolase fold